MDILAAAVGMGILDTVAVVDKPFVVEGNLGTVAGDNSSAVEVDLDLPLRSTVSEQNYKSWASLLNNIKGTSFQFSVCDTFKVMKIMIMASIAVLVMCY